MASSAETGSDEKHESDYSFTSDPRLEDSMAGNPIFQAGMTDSKPCKPTTCATSSVVNLLLAVLCPSTSLCRLSGSEGVISPLADAGGLKLL